MDVQVQNKEVYVVESLTGWRQMQEIVMHLGESMKMAMGLGRKVVYK